MTTAVDTALVPDLPGLVVDEGIVPAHGDKPEAAATAVFDAGRRYRYRLTRVWDSSRPLAVWVMLNPSTANAMEDDRTIGRCRSYAADEWACGGIVVVNLFALRSTDPAKLRTHADPVGPHNAVFVRHAVREAGLVVAAWGAGGVLGNRGPDMGTALGEAGIALQCLGVTSTGQPRHPLYLAKATPLVPYMAAAA